MSGVSAYGTKVAILVTEEFWLIVTPTRVKISQKSSASSARMPAEKLVRNNRRATRKHHSAEDKVRIVLEGSALERQCLKSPRDGCLHGSLSYAIRHKARTLPRPIPPLFGRIPGVLGVDLLTG